MKTALIVLGILAGILILLGTCAAAIGGGVYNGAVERRSDTLTALGNVQVDMQRRYELVPNLVQAVKGSALFEQATQIGVVAERAKATQIKVDASNVTPEAIMAYQKAQGEFNSALSRLLVVVENYPQIKSTENFKELQSQLEGTENRIAVSRKRYNDAANENTKYIQSFPNNIILAIVADGQFKVLPPFEAELEAQKAPKVDFSK